MLQAQYKRMVIIWIPRELNQKKKSPRGLEEDVGC